MSYSYLLCNTCVRFLGISIRVDWCSRRDVRVEAVVDNRCRLVSGVKNDVPYLPRCPTAPPLLRTLQ